VAQDKASRRPDDSSMLQFLFLTTDADDARNRTR